MIYTVDRRKPPLPKAVQWDGENFLEILRFVGAASAEFKANDHVLTVTFPDQLEEVTFTVNLRDWIFQEPTSGRYRVIPRGIFHSEYVIVDEVQNGPEKTFDKAMSKVLNNHGLT